METIDTFYGEMRASVPQNDLIKQSLIEYGEWGLLECYFASTILDPGYLTFDIGAFLGTFSLGLSMFGAAKLVTVEPNPLVLPSLKENMAKNAKILFEIIEKPVGLNDRRILANYKYCR